MHPSRLVSDFALAASLVAAPAALGAQQGAPPVPTTVVMASLTINAGVDRALIEKTMPAEVRETVQLYLDGKIQQWFARADGRGVVFLMNSASVTDAKALLEQLPLARTGLATFEYTALGPLSPLRRLIAAPTAASEDRKP
jgi:hypothetical protein